MRSKRTSHRRDFLKGKSAVDAAADLADHAATTAGASAAIDAAAAPYLVQLSRPAMACEFQIFLNAGQHEEGMTAALAALDLLEPLEQQLTVYRDSSEMSRINRLAAEQPVRIAPELFSLLRQAMELHKKTAGAFDITSGPLTKAWGFSRRAGAVPTADELAAARAVVGSSGVLLDEAECSIRFLRPGMELNLGSIGKGYALDRAAEVMEAQGVHDFLLHGGQSSVLARGSEAGLTLAAANHWTSGWRVGLTHPLRPDRRLVELRLDNRALATSGSGLQFFRHGGKRYGHILDPRSGWPAEGVFSATVLAPTAAMADALSTAFYVLGPGEAVSYCSKNPEIGTVILYPGEQGNSVELAVAGLADNDVRRLNK